MTSVSPIISATGLAKTIGQRTLWRGLDLTVNPGELACITGPSGSGKTTLLNCIGLIDRPDQGTIALTGTSYRRIRGRAARRARRESLGYLFQDFALIDQDTVADNLALALPVTTPRRRKNQVIADALGKVCLAGREGDRVYQLSGGEKQRVALARVLVRRPPVVLADEPTASLDRDNAAVILGLLRGLAAGGAGVLMVSHDPWVVGQADRTIALDERRPA